MFIRRAAVCVLASKFELSILPHDFRKIQALVYLWQLFGTDLNYDYVWDKGIYSPDLNDDLFVSYCADFGDIKPNQQITEPIQHLSNILDLYKETSLRKYEWAELLGTIHYFKNKTRFSNKEDILLAISEWYNDKDAKFAWNTMEKENKLTRQ